MRVFIPLFFNAPLGGLQSHVRAQVEALARAGHAGTVMCKPGPFADSLRNSGIEALTTTFDDVALAAAQACQAGKYDLVHAHPFRGREVGLAVAREQQIPFLVTFHGTYLDSLPAYISDAAAVVAVSPAIRDYLVKAAACPPERIVVIPNGVDTATFAADRPDWARLQSRIPQLRGIDTASKHRRILFISRLDEDKRFMIDVILGGWREVGRRRMFDADWWVAGDGSLCAEMMREAERLDQKAGRQLVRFLGWQDEPTLANLCNACHLVVAPGRAAMEAMACAKPAIAMGSKGYVGLIDSESAMAGVYGNFGGFGQQHDGYVAGTLLEDVERVIYDEDLSERLGRLSHALVDSFFSQRKLDEQLLSLYQTVLAMGQAGTRSRPELRTLELPVLRFSSDHQVGPLSPPWFGPPPGPGWQIAVTAQGTLSVECDLSGERKCYVQGDPAGFDRPPTDRHAWRMAPECEYVFRVPVRVGQAAPEMLFWVIEYDQERRLQHTTAQLVDGLNSVSVRSSAQTTCFRVAVRFTGRGSVLLGPLDVLVKDRTELVRQFVHQPRRSRQLGSFGEYAGENLVFIIGPPRSGTTWLLKLLSSHPDVLAADVDNLDVRINDNKTLETNAFNDNRPFSDAQIKCKFLNLSRCNPGRVIVEKTPVHLLFVDRIVRVFPQAALLLTERDGRDVANSLIHVGRTGSSWWEGAPDTMEKAARHWSQYARAALDCEAHYQPCKVRYEDLLHDPAGELTRVLTVLGLSTEHISAQVEACREGKNIPIPGVFREGRCGGWTKVFSEQDVTTFKALAGDLLVAMGYEADHNWGLGNGNA